jgi:hypothetical protein
MSITVIADNFVFQKALMDAEKIGTVSKLDGLNSPLDSAMMGRFDEAWDEIRGLLKRAFNEGKERAVPLYEEAQVRIGQLLAQAGSKSQVVEDLLVARLRQFQSSFMDGMLEQVRSEIKIGNSIMSISQVQLNQKVTLSGSLKASLAEVIALTSSGELELTATYSNPALAKVG